MDIGRATKAVQTLAPISRSAGTVNGTAVDAKGFAEALIILNSGTNEATGTLDAKVQECDTVGGTYADITGAAFTQVTTANDNAIYAGRIRLTPTRKRFLRVVFVTAVAAGVAGAIIVLGEPENEPAATPAFDIHT